MILRRSRFLLPIAACCVSLSVFSQQHFPREIPAGNYSGICALGDGRYAVVDDKAKEDGFYVFQLDIDTLQGRITGARNLGYHSSGKKNRDMEGICYRPSSQTLFISGEADNEVYEYALDGKRTGKQLNVPAEFKRARRNQGLEALAYDTLSHQFFMTTELPLPGEELLRIQTFDDDLQPVRQYQYKPDAAISRKFYHGVSALCAMGDGRLLVLERQVRVPRLKLDAQTVIRIYEVRPTVDGDTLLKKQLIAEFRTKLTLTGRKFANYEGMYALSPHHLLLVADSQNQYKNVLRDWFLVLAI
ncbi:MAG: esterase-like activity of phytase family protein [Prevotella sp.]|nr:esterase-like activity of phytase family protein [Prevotella sp.]